ncbi:uncharacterized protein [Clytia hemisphaerica]|uniref:Uncharacterized protein n=1 Tax=Clytia hemisphaerica TaxID=252671 RepID=A0A7M5WXT8_9CNID
MSIKELWYTTLTKKFSKRVRNTIKKNIYTVGSGSYDIEKARHSGYVDMFNYDDYDHVTMDDVIDETMTSSSFQPKKKSDASKYQCKSNDVKSRYQYKSDVVNLRHDYKSDVVIHVTDTTHYDIPKLQPLEDDFDVHPAMDSEHFYDVPKAIMHGHHDTPNIKKRQRKTNNARKNRDFHLNVPDRDSMVSGRYQRLVLRKKKELKKQQRRSRINELYENVESGSDSDSDMTDSEDDISGTDSPYEDYYDMYTPLDGCHDQNEKPEFYGRFFSHTLTRDKERLSTGFQRSNFKRSVHRSVNVKFEFKKSNTKLVNTLNRDNPLKKTFDKVKLLATDDWLFELDESKLALELKIRNGLESRILYHHLRGWKPKNGFRASAWKDKFAEDLTVYELFLFISGNCDSKLACRLKIYQVDGYMMSLLVKDELLFRDCLLSLGEIQKLRESFYPIRTRCDAIGEHDLKEKF